MIQDILADETHRQSQFPVTAERIFMGHAGVAPLPKVAVDAIMEYCTRGSVTAQENAWSNGQMLRARQVAARLIGATADEIALLGPTSLGLSLVANGMPWKQGDEVVFYADDYPANVYPWTGLEEKGVRPVRLHSTIPGIINWLELEKVLTPRTRLVSLASCHFLSGYRIDIDGIGKRLHERNILFCVDGIQTLGAFPTNVAHVDFLSADSHKWLLGVMGAGIVFIKKQHQDMIKPSLLGSWNIVSPGFVAQEELRYEPGGRRYEPGALNMPGIIGMLASMELLLSTGIDAIAERLLSLRKLALETLRKHGYKTFSESTGVAPDALPDEWASGIITIFHPEKDMKVLFKSFEQAGIIASLRQNRAGQHFIRLSPHFYNTEEEMERVVAAMVQR